MYWLDTAILVLLGVGAILGAWTGLLKQLVRVVGFGAALYAAVFFHGWAANYLQQAWLREADPRIAAALAYGMVFLAVLLAFQITALVVEKCLKAVKLNWVNRLFGAVVGSVKAALILGAVFLAVIEYPHPNTDQVVRQSQLAPALAGGVDLGLRMVPAQYTDDLRAGLDKLKEAAARKADEVRQQQPTAAIP